MPDKVVFLEDGRTVLRLPLGVESPANSSTFFSSEHMATLLDKGSMDAARKALLKGATVPAPDAEAAAKLLWETIMELVPGQGATLPRKLERARDIFGNVRNANRTPLELIGLSYRPGADSMRDFFFKKLSKQEKSIMKILMDDGREIWTKDQVDQLIADNAGVLKTSQDPLKVFAYYRGGLLERKFLRRVSFEEFSKKYPGVSLV